MTVRETRPHIVARGEGAVIVTAYNSAVVEMLRGLPARYDPKTKEWFVTKSRIGALNRAHDDILAAIKAGEVERAAADRATEEAKKYRLLFRADSSVAIDDAVTVSGLLRQVDSFGETFVARDGALMRFAYTRKPSPEAIVAHEVAQDIERDLYNAREAEHRRLHGRGPRSRIRGRDQT